MEWVWQDVTFELEHSPTRTLEAFGHRDEVTTGQVELNYCDSAILDNNQLRILLKQNTALLSHVCQSVR